MKRAIVAGATGAIGSALIEELTSKKIEVLVLVRHNSNRKNNIIQSPYVTIMECDMEDFSTTENFTGKEYDVFYHFAWAGTTGAGRADMYLQNENVRYSLDAVGMAKRFGCKKFVGAGSQAEYGRFEGMLDSKTPVFPEMGYGYAKLCAGLMTREHAHQQGLEHVWVRILSVYGIHDGKQSMVSSAIDNLMNNNPPSFTKGEQLWDYLYNKDAAKAFRLVGEKGVDGKTYVLGSGSAMPLCDYIKTIQSIVNPACEVLLGAVPYSPTQVMHLQANITDLTNDTGFMPEYTFEKGIKEIFDWIKGQNV